MAISGYANITSGMDGLNDALYSVGPISVSIDATPDSFYYYQGAKKYGSDGKTEKYAWLSTSIETFRRAIVPFEEEKSALSTLSASP